MTSPRPASSFEVPVLVLGHARPATTARVIESLRSVSPRRVYLAVDGPRASVKGEAEEVQTVQDVMQKGIDWPCQVRTLFRGENLGICEGIAESITWFFENEEMGIVLEDDCLPNGSFFSFCEAMLARYQDEPKVMHIGGSCFLEQVDSPYSYFFSKYALVWGWAGWADRWDHFSLDDDRFAALIEEIDLLFSERDQQRYWGTVLGKVLGGEIRSWDYFWGLTIREMGGLAVQPTVPLVRNIGFSTGASNTKWWKDYRGFANQGTKRIDLIHDPPRVDWDPEMDRRVFEAVYRKPAVPLRLFGAVRELVRRRFGDSAVGQAED